MKPPTGGDGRGRALKRQDIRDIFPQGISLRLAYHANEVVLLEFASFCILRNYDLARLSYDSTSGDSPLLLKWGQSPYHTASGDNPIIIYRPWSGWNEWRPIGELATVVIAIADSTGGIGIVVLPTYDFPEPWFVIMGKRTRLFCDKALVPHFPEDGRYSCGVVAMYRGLDGVYSFSQEGERQIMCVPDGRALYEISVAAPDPHEFSIR